MASLKNYTKSLSTLISILPSPVVIADGFGEIHYVNEYACEFFRFDEQALLHAQLDTVIAPSFRQKLKKTITRLIKDTAGKNGRGKTISLYVINSAADTIPVNTALVQVMTNDGQIHVLMLFDDLSIDIAKRDNNERQLNAATNSAEIIDALDLLEDAVAIYDKGWHIQFVNKAGLSVLGRIKKEVLGRKIWILLPYLNKTEYKQAAIEAMKSQRKIQIEEFYPTRQQWFQTSFYPSPNTLVAQMRDITETKNVSAMNAQLTGTLEQAMDVYWSDVNRSKRNKNS